MAHLKFFILAGLIALPAAALSNEESAAEEKKTALHKAIERGEAKAVNFLIGAGAEEKKTTLRKAIERDKYKKPPNRGKWLGGFYRAIQRNERLKVRSYLQDSLPAFHKENLLRYGMISAASAPGDHTRMMELLIEKGANINGRGVLGQTALFVTLDRKKWERLYFLLQQPNTNLHLKNYISNTILHELALINDFKALKAMSLVIRAGANVNLKNKELQTPLHYVAETSELPPMAKSRKAAEHLIKAGIDINAIDKHGKTALDYLSDAPEKQQLYDFLAGSGAKHSKDL